MHVLKINDDRGRTQQWWVNFLWDLRSDNINNTYDLTTEFAKWGASLGNGYSEMLENGTYDSIVFEDERDLTYFLLRWS